MMNRKIRFGVVGTNNITDWFLEGAKIDSRFELVAVCSRSREKGAAFARKHGAPLVFTSVEELAESPDVDAVYIATPNYIHARQAIICMRGGKHVLCEKPMASNAAEVRQMVEESRRNGVALMEAMKTTLTPNFRYIMSHIAEAGKLRRYFASYCKYSTRYDKFKDGIVLNAFKRELSNGSVMDIGIYTIYPMVVLFGRPARISASAFLLSTGVDGQGTVSFGYPEMEASVIFSKIADSFLPSEIEGEGGTITISDIHDFRRVDFHRRPDNSIETWGGEDSVNGYYYEAAEFINLIVNGQIESAINSHENSLITIEIIDEIRRQSGVRYPADDLL